MTEDMLIQAVGGIFMALVFGAVFFIFVKVFRRLSDAFRGGGAKEVIGGIGGSGGWSRLAEHWAAALPPPERLIRHQTVKIGSVVYRRTTTIGASDAGLYLAQGGLSRLFARKPLFVPWTAIVRREPTRLHWLPSLRFTVGPPADTDIVLYQDVADRLGIGKAREP